MRSWKIMAAVVGVCVTALGGVVSAAVPAGKPDDAAALRQEIAELRAQVKTLEERLSRPATPSAPAAVQPSEDDLMMWDPFAQLEAMQRHVAAMNSSLSGPGMAGHGRGFSLLSDIRETDKSYVVTFDLPGMDKSKINVEVKDGLLHVSGERSEEVAADNRGQYYRQERSFGYFSQAVRLPADADPDGVQAAYDKGVLTVTVAKKTGARSRQKIDVK